MKKLILASAIALMMSGAYAQSVPYTDASATSGAAGQVGSQSAATSATIGAGTAFTSTQSGSFATFGQTGAFAPAWNGETGGTNTIGGTANVAGFAATSQYGSSSTTTTGAGIAASNSWNSATASAQSNVNAVPTVGGLPGYTGVASGIATSANAGKVGTMSDVSYGGAIQLQGNSGSNQSGYAASDSGIGFQTTAAIGGQTVVLSNLKTETSAMTFSNGTQTNDTNYGQTWVPGSTYTNGVFTVANSSLNGGTNTIVKNEGNASAVAN